MGKVLFWTSLSVLFMVLCEATILANLPFMPVVPDLVLLIVVYVSFMNSAVAGTTIGFISGFLLDFLSASPVGLNAAIKTLTGYIAGKFSGSFNLDRIMMPALMGASATLVKAVATWFLFFFFGDSVLPYRLNGSLFWFELIANTVAAPIVFAFLGLFPTLFVNRTRNRE